MKSLNHSVNLRNAGLFAALLIQVFMICFGCSMTTVMYSFERKDINEKSLENKQSNCKAVIRAVCTYVKIPLVRSESIVNQCRAYFEFDRLIRGSDEKIKKKFGVAFDCPPLCANCTDTFRKDQRYIFYFSDDNKIQDIGESEVMP